MAIVELQRILIDEEGVPWDEAWAIVTATFAYTNHTVLSMSTILFHLLPVDNVLGEALEKWQVPVMSHLLPRIMQIIFDINLFHLQAVERKYPNDREKLARMSIIEEGVSSMYWSGAVC